MANVNGKMSVEQQSQAAGVGTAAVQSFSDHSSKMADANNATESTLNNTANSGGDAVAETTRNALQFANLVF